MKPIEQLKEIIQTARQVSDKAFEELMPRLPLTLYDEEEQFIYDLPFTFMVDKYSVYEQYYIVEIVKGDAGEVILVGKSAEDEIKTFDWEDLNILEKFEILRYIDELG